MSNLVRRIRDSQAVGQQLVAQGYRPQWYLQYVVSVPARTLRAIDLRTGTVTATVQLPRTPVSTAVVPAVPGSIAATPFNPSGPVFYVAIVYANDDAIHFYDLTTLAQLTEVQAFPGTRGILYAALLGIVFDGPNGELVYYDQQQARTLDSRRLPQGTPTFATWVPPTTGPEVHYIINGQGELYVMQFDAARKWTWYSTITGQGVADAAKIMTDGSNAWPRYGQASRLRILCGGPLRGGRTVDYDITDPLNPAFLSADHSNTPFVLTDIAGASTTARATTVEDNGDFPLIEQRNPLTSVAPADPGPDSVGLGLVMSGDQGEWWVLGSNAYTPTFQYQTAQYSFSSNGSSPHSKVYFVTPPFTTGTWISPADGTYNALIRVRGQTECIVMSGGTAVTGSGGRATLNGTITQTTFDRFTLVAGANTYVLNTQLSGDTGIFHGLDYTITVPLPPSTIVTFRYDTIDGLSTIAFENLGDFYPADDDPGRPYTAALHSDLPTPRVLLPFWEGSGTVAHSDYPDPVVSGGRDATLVNGVTWVTGQPGTGHAIHLTRASSQYASFLTGFTVGLSSCTIAAWVYITSSGSQQRVFDFGTGTSNYVYLTVQGSGGTPKFGIKPTAVSEQSATAPSALSIGAWHHLAVTIDGARAFLYVDGVAVATVATTYTPSSLGVTTQNWLGRSQFSGDSYFDGSIDDFRVYDTALTSYQVSVLAGNVAAGSLGATQQVDILSLTKVS